MAVGFWKSPTEASYIAPGDTSQNLHIEGLPLGTRGGMLVRHNFPADGEYKFSVQNYGLGTYIPGEQLEFLIDGQRVVSTPLRRPRSAHINPPPPRPTASRAAGPVLPLPLTTQFKPPAGTRR